MKDMIITDDESGEGKIDSNLEDNQDINDNDHEDGDNDDDSNEGDSNSSEREMEC